jgi:hypothetical protein
MMKLASLFVCALVATAAAEIKQVAPKLTPMTAGPAWLKLILTTEKLPAASKERPIEYWITAPVKACKKLKTGKAVSNAHAKQLKTCLQEQLKAIGTEGLSIKPEEPTLLELEKLITHFEPKHHKAMRAATKGTTAVEIRYLGDGETMDVTLAFTPEFHVRAIWVEHGEFE